MKITYGPKRNVHSICVFDYENALNPVMLIMSTGNANYDTAYIGDYLITKPDVYMAFCKLAGWEVGTVKSYFHYLTYFYSDYAGH